LKLRLLRRREKQSNRGVSRWKVSIGIVNERNTRASSSERCFALRRCHRIKASISCLLIFVGVLDGWHATARVEAYPSCTERCQMGNNLQSKHGDVASFSQLQYQPTRCRIASGKFCRSQLLTSAPAQRHATNNLHWPDHLCTIISASGGIRDSDSFFGLT
jgi:hypothetical protein